MAGLGQVAQAPFLFTVAGLLLTLPVPIMLLNLAGWSWSPGAAAFGAAVTMILGSGSEIEGGLVVVPGLSRFK